MDGFDELPPDAKLDHEAAPPAGQPDTPAAPTQWSKAEEQQIVRFAQTAKTPEELAQFATSLNPNVTLTPEHAKAIIDHRDKYGEVSSKFTAPEGGRVDQVPDGFDAVPEDAKIDYGTKSGLSPEEIKARVEKLPEILRPGLSDLAGSGYVMGLDNEGVGIAHAVGSMLLHPEESIRSQGKNIADAYHEGRTNALMLDDYARLQHPDLAPVAEIGGAIANPIGRTAKGLVGLAKAGGVVGGISGFEDGNGSLTDRLEEGAKGGIIGAAAAPIIGAALHAPAAVIRAGKSVLGGSPGLARRIVANAIKADGSTAAEVGGEMASAHQNGVPYMLADSGDNARGTLAAAVRAPGPARTLARDAVEQRQSGLPERVVGAIERDLGPVANPHEVADQMMTQARNSSAPLYDKFYNAAPVKSPAIDALLARPSMQKAMNRAYRLAAEEGRNPEALGLVKDANGDVVFNTKPRSAEDIDAANASRFHSPEMPDEFHELDVNKVKTGTGGHATVRGPLDMTQQLRAWGGVRDDGGELSHLGVGADRKLPFGGSERFLGKLVHDKGMPLDDAALRLWEAGYFPSFHERPTVQDLLDHLDAEARGSNRFFTPQDYHQVDRFHEAQDQRLSQAADPKVEDTSQPAGAEHTSANRGPAPEPLVDKAYTPQTLDYIKRGMDDVVETYRDPTTGKLNLDTEGRAINNSLRSYVGQVDKLYPDYAAARAAYAGPVRGIDAMNQGRKALNMTADDLEARMRDMTPFEKEMFALGHRRAMAELVYSKGDSANVINAIVGTGKKRAMLARLHGDRPAFNRFVQTLGQEKEGFNTFARSTLGSPTAINLQDDQSLKVASAAADLVTSGFSPIAALQQVAKFGFGKLGAKTREHVAALLSETDPASFQKLAAELRAEAARRGIVTHKINVVANAGGKAAIAARQ